MKNAFPLQNRSYAAGQIDTIAVLWVIREEGPIGTEELYARVYGDAGGWGDRPRYTLETVLKKLIDAGLVIEKPHPELPSAGTQASSQHAAPDRRTFSASPRLGDLQQVFGISLKEHVRHLGQLERFIQAYPMLGKPRSSQDVHGLNVFVMMPFKPEMRHIYDPHILNVTNKLKLTCRRGDDFFTTHNILQDIWAAVYHADVCIADCTGRNPNVFYEIGMAHTYGTPCILLAQSMEDIPFDVNQIRFITYDNTPEGLAALESKLEKTLGNALGPYGATE